MKTIKIIIVAIIVAALGLGLFYMVKSHERGSGVNVTVSSSIKVQDIQKRIHETIEAPSTSSLSSRRSNYNEIYKSIEFYFNSSNKEESNYKTCLAELNVAFMSAISDYAKMTFEGKKWSANDIKDIRQQTSFMKSVYPESERIKEIEKTLEGYDRLAKFNREVLQQCATKPLDNNVSWDQEECSRLLGAIPSAQGLLTNCPLYEKTRKKEVQNRLYKAHYEFLTLAKTIARNAGYSNIVSSSYNNELNSFRNFAVSSSGYGQSYDDVMTKYKNLKIQ